MNKDILRNNLFRDKAFLRELYEAQDRSRSNNLLTSASDSKIDTLIKFLHFLANGEITIKKANFEIIQSQRKLRFLKKNVEKKAAVKRLLKSERLQKLKFLKQLSSVFSPLLDCLFNED